MLEALDDVASRTEPGMATMLHGVIEPARGRLELFNVGHPPPLGGSAWAHGIGHQHGLSHE